MQLLQALLALAILPATLARSTGHAHLHERSDGLNHLEVRQGSTKFHPPCSKRGAHIVASSGHGAPNVAGWGLLITTAQSIQKAIPYSSSHSTVYDKQNNNTIEGIATGVTNLTAHIEWYTAGCPNTPIILLGYSEGGIVTMNTLCGRSSPGGTTQGIDPKYNANIAAIVLYGEETRTSGQCYNAGTCTTGKGVNPRLNPAACGVFANNMRSWCDVQDPQCCQQPNDPSAPYNQSVHYVYPSEYDQDATAYAVNKFNVWKADKKAGTTATVTCLATTAPQV